MKTLSAVASILILVAQVSYASTVSAEAQQYWLGRIGIRGNPRTSESVIRRMIPLNEGDLFDQSKWDYGIEQLNRSGLFEPITPRDVDFLFDEVRSVVHVELRLRERDHRRVDLNAGGGSTGGASVGLDYSDINLTGRADRFIARSRVGSREREMSAAYSIIPLTKSPITVELSGYYRRLELVDARVAGREREPLFIERTAGAGLGFTFALAGSRYSISTPARAGFFYSFSSTNLADALLQPGVIERNLEQTNLRTAALTALLVHDTLDRGLDPVRGQQLTLSAEIGARLLGGSINTVKPQLDYRRFFLAGRMRTGEREPNVIGLRVRASHILAFGERFRPDALSAVNGVPIFRRFFVGGESEVRGFDINSIAPLARVDRFLIIDGGEPALVSSELRPVGGDTRLLFNAEYRVPLVWRLSAAAFFDIGASFNARRIEEQTIESLTRVEPFAVPATLLTVLRRLGADDVKLPAYRYSLGAELRLPIPVINLPVRLIVTYNPNAQTGLPQSTRLAPEGRFTFRFGFSRTL
jgi:outer membrane protein insertion porin family